MKLALTFISMVLILSAHGAQAQSPNDPRNPIELTPDGLRVQILSGNLPLYQQLLQLEDARDQVTQARAAFLPSLNLSALVSSGPSFILKQVTALLPFLLPSTYFQLDQAQDNFEADLAGFKIVELNTLATALTLYYTILADQKVYQVYQEEANNLERLAQDKVAVNAIFKYYSDEDIHAAQGSADTALINANAFRIKLISEMDSLKQALGLDQEQPMSLQDGSVAPSEYENQEIKTVTQLALNRSVERIQIAYLVKAAQAGALNKDLAFLTSATLSSKSDSSGQASSTFQLGGSANIGFGEFSQVSQNGRYVEEIRAQDTALRLADANLVATTLQNLKVYQSSVKLALDAVNQYQEAYDAALANYSQGLGDIFSVLNLHSQLTSAKVALIESQMNLDLGRLNLHRVLITDGFAQIKGCAAHPLVAPAWWDIFSTPNPKLKLDQICVEGGTRQPQ